MEESSPYSHLSLEHRDNLRDNLIKNLISDETNFVFSLKSITHEVINPMELRDTPFKRTFLADPIVAVSFNLILEIQKACSDFLLAVVQAACEKDIADAYKYFSPSLQLFAQYATQNSKFLNVVERNARNLAPFVPSELNLEATLISPLEHYTTYRNTLKEIFWLMSPEHPDILSIIDALQAISSQTDIIDMKLKDEIESLVVLNLQSQCESLSFLKVFSLSL